MESKDEPCNFSTVQLQIRNVTSKWYKTDENVDADESLSVVAMQQKRGWKELLSLRHSCRGRG